MKSLLPLFFIALILSGTSVHAQLKEGEQYLTINGAKLFINVIGTGKPLLVIHGGPGLNQSYFLPYLQPLAKNNQLILFDQRACGKSAIPSKDSVSMNFMVQDIEALRKKAGVARIQILAHSWGSLLATLYAMKYPDRIEKLILSNPSPLSHEYDQQMMEFIRAHTSAEDSMKMVTMYHSSSIDINNYEKLIRISFKATAYKREHIDSIQFDLPDNYLQSTQALMGGLQKDLANYNYYPNVKGFRFRTLILEGKYDGIPTESIERLHRLITTSRVYRFEYSGHFPFVEEPGTFVKVVNEFLKRG